MGNLRSKRLQKVIKQVIFSMTSPAHLLSSYGKLPIKIYEVIGIDASPETSE